MQSNSETESRCLHTRSAEIRMRIIATTNQLAQLQFELDSVDRQLADVQQLAR